MANGVLINTSEVSENPSPGRVQAFSGKYGIRFLKRVWILQKASLSRRARFSLVLRFTLQVRLRFNAAKAILTPHGFGLIVPAKQDSRLYLQLYGNKPQ